MERANIEKIAQTAEDRVLLAKLWDKVSGAIHKDIPASTAFLSMREQALAQYLFGDVSGLVSFGGYPVAERKMLVYLPEYLDEDFLYGGDGPVSCLRAVFYEGDSLSHRDFLGALMGAGISRDVVGDICVSKGSCDFFVTSQITPYLLEQFECAGRTKLQLEQIPLSQAVIPEPEVKQVRDTLASLRLDSVIAAGFSISRSAAAQLITAEKASVNGIPCNKPNKLVSEDSAISLRGHGKIKLASINGQTKKGRISVVIHRYV